MVPAVTLPSRLMPLLLATGVLAAPACGHLDASPESRGRFGAWITYWDFDRGVARLNSARPLFDDVFFFLAELDADGRPVLARHDLAHAGVVRDVRARGARAWMTVVNDRRTVKGRPAILKDAAHVHATLADPDRRAAHRRAIVDLAVLHAFSGVDLDYENLLPEDRDRFSTFVRELGADLAARGLRFSVTVQPKQQESRSAGPGAADWAQLCLAADRLQIMLYNLHSARSDPGPLTAPEWMRQVLSYARAQCDPARIVPVLKLGGIDWGPAGAKDLQHADVQALLATNAATLQREPDGATPWFRYVGPDGPHTVYFEDAESILKKVAVLEQIGCPQVVLWSLGREDAQLLPQLLGGNAPSASSSPGTPR
jgi:spore germination protein YaaH